MARFANADYALAGALKGTEDIARIVLAYDINCAYCKNIKHRFDTHFPELADSIHKIDHLIPKLHIYGHKELCQILHSFNYTSGVGRTDGEAIERVWALDNNNIVSTREMDSGHRHDILNDQHSALNFDKTTGLGKISDFLNCYMC